MEGFKNRRASSAKNREQALQKLHTRKETKEKKQDKETNTPISPQGEDEPAEEKETQTASSSPGKQTPTASTISKRDLEKQYAQEYPKFINAFNKVMETKYIAVKGKRMQDFIKIRSNFSIDDILIALKNAMEDDYLMGTNPRNESGKVYLTPDYILRMDKFEKYLNQKPNKTT